MLSEQPWGCNNLNCYTFLVHFPRVVDRIAPMKTLNQHQAEAVAAAAVNTCGKFTYPTGTGKSLIEARIISDHIKNHNGLVFSVLAPRIMLSQQLFQDIFQDLLEGGKSCLFFSLHSGATVTLKGAVSRMYSKVNKKKAEELEHVDVDVDDLDQDDELDALSVKIILRNAGVDTDLNFRSGTHEKDLLAAVADAKARGIPLVICSTYHSSHVLNCLKKIDTCIDVLIADEAHNTVSLEFSDVHNLPAIKRFYFTATEKNTKGTFGMQNEELFGKRLGCMSAATAVSRKLIVRPRIHYVTTSVPVLKNSEPKADVRAVEECYKEHARMINIGAKLLVTVRGSKPMRDMLNSSNFFQRLRNVRPNLTVFSILASKEDVRINGEIKTREEFMKRLQSLTDADQALILHYDILSEGIDVPGITGVMPLRLLGTGKFLQMLGRATRLHPNDRASDVKPTEEFWYENFVKPYAWLVLPYYGHAADEQLSTSEYYIERLRDYGFIPGEDEWFSEANGEKAPVPVESLYTPREKIASLEFDGKIVQRIEERRLSEAYEEADLADLFM
jgi:superfamily II DNA or RNA helicase